jgi:hypothetical protein
MMELGVDGTFKRRLKPFGNRVICPLKNDIKNIFIYTPAYDQEFPDMIN